MLTDLSVTPIAETIRRLSAELQERRPPGPVGQGGEDDLLRPRPARLRRQQPEEGPPGRGPGRARPDHRRAVPRGLGPHEGGPEAALRRGPRPVRAHGQEGARRLGGPPGPPHRPLALRAHGGGGVLRGAQVRDPARLHGQPLHPQDPLRRHPLDAEPRARPGRPRQPGPRRGARVRPSLPLRQEALRGGEGDPGDGRSARSRCAAWPGRRGASRSRACGPSTRSWPRASSRTRKGRRPRPSPSCTWRRARSCSPRSSGSPIPRARKRSARRSRTSWSAPRTSTARPG